MKHTSHLLIDAVLATALAVGLFNVQTSLHAQLSDTELAGYLETADCTRISGWAMDVTVPDPVKIAVFSRTPNGVTERLLGYLPAKRKRADVEKIFGHGMHGFSFLTPSALMLGREVHVNVYAVSKDGKTRQKLEGSPKTLLCEKKATVRTSSQTQPETKTIKSTKYEVAPATLRQGFTAPRARTNTNDYVPIFYSTPSTSTIQTSASASSAGASSAASVSSASSSSRSSAASSSRKSLGNTIEDNAAAPLFEQDLLENQYNPENSAAPN